MDLLFLQDFILDGFLLIFVSLFLKLPTTGFKLVLAAVLGSAQSCLRAVLLGGQVLMYPQMIRGAEKNPVLGCFLMLLGLACMTISYILIGMLMVYLAFGMQSRHVLMKATAVFYGAAIFTGGVFLSLRELITPIHHLFFSEEFSSCKMLWGWLFLAVALLICAALCIAFLRAWFGSRSSAGHIFGMDIYMADKKISLQGLMDTGNSLLDPVTRLPVTLVEQGLLEAAFGSLEAYGLFGVPYQAVGTSFGILWAFRAKSLVIHRGRQRNVHCGAVIGVFPGCFHKNGSYQAILHPDLF